LELTGAATDRPTRTDNGAMKGQSVVQSNGGLSGTNERAVESLRTRTATTPTMEESPRWKDMNLTEDSPEQNNKSAWRSLRHLYYRDTSIQLVFTGARTMDRTEESPATTAND
jgi:hypothetical protein